MKTLLSICIVSTAFFSTNAQITNTFPDDGNVGIGTTLPNGKLHVEGRTRTGQNGTLHLDWTYQNNWNGSSYKWAGHIGFNAYRNNDDSKDYYYGSNRYTAKGVFEGSNYGFRWLFRSPVNNDSDGQHLLAEHMRLNTNGNLGIGTSSPLSKVHIFNGSSGQNPHNFSDLSVEDTDHVMLSLMTYKTKQAYYGFADTDDDFVGGIQYSHPDDAMYFRVNNHSSDMMIDANGNVGIGTTSPGIYKLAVNGSIRAKEIKVETGWADYVFKEDYDLPTLQEVEKHIKEKGHLINIPSAEEVEENGIQLGEMNMKLLEKIEELTLYLIDLQNKTDKQQLEIKRLNQIIKEK